MSAVQTQTYQYNDCLSCRIIGAGSLTGLGAYSIYSSRANAPGSVNGRRALVGVGAVLIGAGVMRWFKKPLTTTHEHR